MRRLSTETKRVMFWALSAARCAGETHVTSGRIASAAFTTPSVAAFCEEAHLSCAHLAAAADGPGVMATAECQRIAEQQLAEKGIPIGSREHLDSVRPLPHEPTARAVVHAVWSAADERAITPLELLLALIRADESLRARLASHGLNEEALRSADRPSGCDGYPHS